MIAVIQGMTACPLITEIRDQDGRMPVGVGVVRPGLSGAAASIADAQLALPLAVRSGDVVFFAQQWLLATLLPQAHRLAPVLGSCRPPAMTHPELAETVARFARSGMSLTATGRAMHLNPNTVKYRLRRWHELTGWDPRTWDGLAASILALGLFPAPTTDDADDAGLA
jgi:sugar diacid utilization regulator